MARTDATSIINEVKRLVGMETSAESPWTSDVIEGYLDMWRVRFDWVLLAHDPDWHVYRCVSPDEIEFARTTVISLAEVSVPDFSLYRKVGWLEAPILRDGRLESGNQSVPTTLNIVDGTFTFSSPPQKELYLQGWGHNPFMAASMILSEERDSTQSGRRPVKSWRRGMVSETYDIGGRIKRLNNWGAGLNQKKKRLHRG